MKLNLKDRRILSVLDLHGRATYQQIGKSVGVSKESVIYRIRRLEKTGVIGRYTTLINFGKLGKTGFGVFNRFQNVDEKTKSEMIQFLAIIPELYWIALVGGKYDLVYGVMCSSIFEFNIIHYKILNKFGKHLVDNTIAVRTELRQNRRAYLLEESQPAYGAPYFGKEPEMQALDALDSDILNQLSNQARLSLVELSEILDKPASTLSYRIKQMETRGIIQGYTAYIRAQKFGMQSYRLLLYLENMDVKARNKLFMYVYENKHMILAIETVSPWNFEITLEVESHQHLQKEMSKLRDVFSKNIRNMDFLIMFEDDLVYDPYPLKKMKRDTTNLND